MNLTRASQPHAPLRQRSTVSRLVRPLVALGSVLALCALTACSEQETLEVPIAQNFEMPLPQGAVVLQAKELGAVNTGAVTLGSLAPDSATVAERIPDIKQRGRLIVGVPQSQNLLAYRNPATGEVEGFEADIAREIARDIFDDPNAIEFRFIRADTWLTTLNSGEVDFVLNSISITRKRQDVVFFSTPYFRASARLLVPSTSHIESLADLHNQRICVTQNSTSGQRIAQEVPDQELLVVTSAADCLLALQQNQVGAILSDDAILSGMIAQDPFTKLAGDPTEVEKYGIAFAKPSSRHDTTGLVRQVNATLERIFQDGTWSELADQWLGSYLPTTAPPPVQYRSAKAADQLFSPRSTLPEQATTTTNSRGEEQP